MSYRSTSPPNYTFSVPGFTRAVKVLIIATTAVFILQYVSQTLNGLLTGYFALFPAAVIHGQIWRLGSYLFLHASLSHLFWNMFALWMFGVWVEEGLGTRRLYQLYFISGVGGGIVDTLAHLWLMPGQLTYTIGASGAIFGILLAVAILYWDRPVFLLLPPVTIKAGWMVVGYGALEFLFTLRSLSGYDPIAHFAHLGGMLFAWFYLKSGRPNLGIMHGFQRWQRRRMQRRFEVYMNRRDRRPPGGWTH